MVGLLALAMIGGLVNASILMEETKLLYYKFLPACWSNTAGSSIYSFWVPFTICNSGTMFLTLTKVVPFRDGRSAVDSLFARDSIVYFAVLFSTMMISEVVYRLGIPLSLLLPAECIACILISRMMMNIRELVKDDPDYTAYL